MTGKAHTEAAGRIPVDGSDRGDGAGPAPHKAPAAQTALKIKKYFNFHVLEQDMAKYVTTGYRVQTHTTRNLPGRLRAGVFTRNRVHTVTYVKP